ncbi:MAG: aldo/keto reductase [Candidatus Aminicenantes bacterium]|nr:aldo/keto reductase [Candidatus Aminicenantes bacterium]
MKRRDFISKGLPGFAGTMALSQIGCKGGAYKKAEGEKKYKLVYRTLGKTGIKVPIVSMGSMNVTSEALVRMALDAGISHISTAKYYGRGKVEKFVGKVIKNYRREDIILATGVDPHPPPWKEGFYSKDTDIVRFEKDFDDSLKSMEVDYVDIFYLPNAAKKEAVMFEPLMKVMEKIKKAGKARFLGIGTHSYVPEAVRAAADSDFWDVVMLAYNFQSRDIEERKKAVDYAAEKGMGIVAMKTVTGASFVNTNKQIQVGNPRAALKWVLQNPNIHTTVLGITNFEQLETDLSVMADLTLTDDEKKYLELARLNHKNMLFCQGCGDCLKQCKSAPDIPALMRCYMYAYGYRDLAAAVRNLDPIKEKTVACIECSNCTVNCASGFNIKERIQDIIRLRDFPHEFFV